MTTTSQTATDDSSTESKHTVYVNVTGTHSSPYEGWVRVVDDVSADAADAIRDHLEAFLYSADMYDDYQWTHIYDHTNGEPELRELPDDVPLYSDVLDDYDHRVAATWFDVLDMVVSLVEIDA